MLRLTLVLIVLAPVAVQGQGLLTCSAPTAHWSDYYAALAFSETQFDDIRGTHRMTAAEAAERNHFRFDYDRNRRLVRVTFALGNTPRSVNNHTRTFFSETAVVTICHHDGMEVRHFLDDRGNPALTKGNVAEERYVLDSLGYRTALTFHDAAGQPVQNGWGTARITWERRKDGTVIEHRVDAAGSPAPIRPGFPFHRLRFHYGHNGWLVLMENIDSAGNLVRSPQHAAQDHLEYRPTGEMLAWNVYDEYEARVEGNPPNVARGIRIYDTNGYHQELRHQDRHFGPMADAGGVVRLIHTFDRFGNLATRRTADSTGRTVMLTSAGFATVRETWDASGLRHLRTEFLDAEDRPVLSQGGFAAIDRIHDDRGLVRELRFLDVTGRLASRANGGVAIQALEYDAQRRLTRVRYLDANRAPVALQGVAEQEIRYRPNGYIAGVVRRDREGRSIEPSTPGNSRPE